MALMIPTSLEDILFFDTLFQEAADQGMARLCHDLRTSMRRLGAVDLLSAREDRDAKIARLRHKEVTEDGKRRLDISLNVSPYRTEEVQVKVEDDKYLVVDASHEDKDDHTTIKSSFHQRFLLPEGTDVHGLKATRTKDGVLTIRAPLPPAAVEGAKERPVPIETEKAEDKAEDKSEKSGEGEEKME